MTGHNDVYRDGRVHVRADACDHCLFSRDRIVSGARARELVEQTRATVGSSFICHRNQVSDAPAAICTAWWERFAGEDPIMRLAIIAGVVVRVDEEGAATPLTP